MYFDGALPNLSSLVLVGCVYFRRVLVRSQCDNAFECAYAYYISGSSSCNGFSSCIYTDNIYTSDCFGAYSCYGAEDIYDFNSGVTCHGLRSCSNVESLSSGGELSCSGELSCADSLINVELLYCNGYRSCASSSIYISDDGTDEIYIHGSYGAADSLFIVDSITINDFDESFSTVYFYFSGAWSGYNSTIFCGFKKTCALVCSGYHACDLLTWYCGSQEFNTGNVGCDVYILCGENENMTSPETENSVASTRCATVDLSLTSVPSEITTFDNSIAICNTSEGTNNVTKDMIQICDDASECFASSDIYTPTPEFQYLNSTSSNGRVCCTAYEACDSQNSRFVNQLNSLTVRCDAYMSCDYSSVDLQSEGSVYGTGYLALESATVSNGKNAFCTAEESCSSLQYVQNVYCGGYQSCGFIWYANQAFVLATEAGGWFRHMTQNIYCVASFACQGSYILNVSGTVYGLGDSVLSRASLHNVSHIVVNGYEALYGSTISGASSIKAEGVRALEFASIESALHGGTLDVWINMTANDNIMYFTCTQGDHCNINCVSATACQYMALSCFGVCEVYCNAENGIICPDATVGTEYTIVKYVINSAMANQTIMIEESDTGSETGSVGNENTNETAESGSGESNSGSSGTESDSDEGMVVWLAVITFIVVVLAFVAGYYCRKSRDNSYKIDLMQKMSHSKTVQSVDIASSPSSPVVESPVKAETTTNEVAMAEVIHTSTAGKE